MRKIAVNCTKLRLFSCEGVGIAQWPHRLPKGMSLSLSHAGCFIHPEQRKGISDWKSAVLLFSCAMFALAPTPKGRDNRNV
jgi:hypothetical protein